MKTLILLFLINTCQIASGQIINTFEVKRLDNTLRAPSKIVKKWVLTSSFPYIKLNPTRYKSQLSDPPYSYDKTPLYPKTKFYPQNETQHQYLLTAVHFKLSSNEIQAKIDSINNQKIIELKSITNREEIEAVERKYGALILPYLKSQEDLHKFSVKYFYLFRGDRTLQLFPVGIYDTDIRAELFYENNINSKNNKILGSYLLSYGNKGKISAYTELYSDYFGPFRLGVGTLVSNNLTVGRDSAGVTIIDSTERKDDALQRILGGGGNLVTNLDWPFLLIRSRNERIRLLSSVNIRNSIDIPDIGTYSSDFIEKFDPAISSVLFLSGYKEELVFFATYRFSRLLGNDELFNYLNIKDTNTRRWGLWTNQISTGLIISSMLRVGVNFNFGNPYVIRNFPTNIFLGIVPK